MQAIRNAASHVPGSQSCWQRNWPRVFLFFALATAVLCFVAIITGLITAVIRPRMMLLSIYCLIFALLGFSAEMRQFAWCRRIVYLWMRYFYFLTYYKARAIFYIMFGCLLLTDRALDIIAAVVTLVLGVMMLLVSLIVDLPVFEDPREQQEKEEEYRSYYSGPTANGNGANAATTAGAAAANSQNMATTGFGASNNNNDADVQEDTPAQFTSGAQTAHSAKVPPSAILAQANNNNSNYAEKAYGNSSDDEPARRENAEGYNSNNYSPNANPYDTSNSNVYSSREKSGPGMFAPSTASRTTSVAPPLQEAGVTRGGNSESAIRRDFAAAVASNVKDDDLR